MSRSPGGAFDEPGLVVEDGLRFSVPMAEGQKTGWFFRSGPRIGRAPVQVRAERARRRAGRVQLSGCVGPCAPQGPGHPRSCVWTVSQSALELAVQNGERNGFTVVDAQGRRLRRARGAGQGGWPGSMW